MVEETKSLRRVMGGMAMFAMAAGSIIGPWLVMMQWWISLSGPSIALAFVITGLLCIPIGLVYGEMTSMLPNVGGPFVFIYNAFGKEAAFWGAWSLMLAYSTVIAFQLYAIGGLISYLWWPEMPHTALVVICIVLCLILFFMNSKALSLSSNAQIVMFFVLVIIGVGTMIAFITHPSFSTDNWTPFFTTGTGGFLTATALMVTMYFGFELVPQFAEESKYPVKKLWIPLIGSIIFCILFYSGLCIVNSGMLPFDALSKMEMTSASLLKTHFGVAAQYAMAIATLLACFTCLNGFWLGSIRLMYSMGEARILPRWFGGLNESDVPSNANVAILLIVFVFIAISGTRWLESLFTLMAIGVSICYAFSSAAHIKLRNKHPEWKRPWKAPGGVGMGVLAVICSLVMAYYTFKYFDVTLWVLFVIYFIGLGGPVWLYLRHRRKQSPDVYVINVPTGTVE